MWEWLCVCRKITHSGRISGKHSHSLLVYCSLIHLKNINLKEDLLLSIFPVCGAIYICSAFRCAAECFRCRTCVLIVVAFAGFGVWGWISARRERRERRKYVLYVRRWYYKRDSLVEALWLSKYPPCTSPRNCFSCTTIKPSVKFSVFSCADRKKLECQNTSSNVICESVRIASRGLKPTPYYRFYLEYIHKCLRRHHTPQSTGVIGPDNTEYVLWLDWMIAKHLRMVCWWFYHTENRGE